MYGTMTNGATMGFHLAFHSTSAPGRWGFLVDFEHGYIQRDTSNAKTYATVEDAESDKWRLVQEIIRGDFEHSNFTEDRARGMRVVDTDQAKRICDSSRGFNPTPVT